MNKLLNLIEKGESETVEFKPSLSDLNRVVEVVSSFVNKKGGIILNPFKPKLPKIIDTGNTVFVTLFSAKLEDFGIEREKLRQFDRDMVNEWLTKVNAKLTQELSDKEKEIIFFAIKNKKITSADCQRLLNISRVMANRYFGGLIKKRLLNKKEAGRFTYYTLKIQKGEENE